MLSTSPTQTGLVHGSISYETDSRSTHNRLSCMARLHQGSRHYGERDTIRTSSGEYVGGDTTGEQIEVVDIPD